MTFSQLSSAINDIQQATGNATASDVISGKTFSSINGNGQVGTIPIKSAATITPGVSNQTIAAGQYLSGIQTIAGDVDLVTANIKAGANIFGVAGKSSVVDTADANAVDADLKNGKTAYVNGNKITGTLIPFSLVAGDADLFFQAGTTQYGSFDNGQKIFEKTINVDGVVRFKYSASQSYSRTVQTQVYINGVARGTLRVTTSKSLVQYIEDFTINAGDKIQLYIIDINGNYGQIGEYHISSGSLLIS